MEELDPTTFSQKISVGGEQFDYQHILKTLAPRVTPERLQRLKQVIQGRCYSVAPVLENIYDRGNISAVMRSAEAFGYLNFKIIEPENSRFKAANRVTQGTDKWLTIKKYSSTPRCLEELKNEGFKIYATSLEAETPIDQIDFTQKSAVVFGNEKEGISSEMKSLCDNTFILPMYGFAQSFNISVAAALTFYHIFLQRKKIPSELSEAQKDWLLAQYLLKSVPRAELYTKSRN